MAGPVRLYVCDDRAESDICCPVKFPVEVSSDNSIYINSDDVNELVAAIHAADDDIQNGEDDDE